MSLQYPEKARGVISGQHTGCGTRLSPLGGAAREFKMQKEPYLRASEITQEQMMI